MLFSCRIERDPRAVRASIFLKQLNMSDISTCTSLLIASLEAHQHGLGAVSSNLQSNLNINAYNSINILIYHTKNEIPMCRCKCS